MTTQGVIRLHCGSRPSKENSDPHLVDLDPVKAGSASNVEGFNAATTETLALAETLLALESDGSEVDRSVRFEFEGKRVRWADLCFEHGRYHELMGGSSKGYAATSKLHPIILAGEVKTSKAVRGGVRVLLVAEVGQLDGEKVFIRPAFRISQKWKDRFTDGASVLIVGMFGVTHEPSPSKSRAATVWINMVVQRLRQVRVLEDPPAEGPAAPAEAPNLVPVQSPLDTLGTAYHEFLVACSAGKRQDAQRLATEIREQLAKIEASI